MPCGASAASCTHCIKHKSELSVHAGSSFTSPLAISAIIDVIMALSISCASVENSPSTSLFEDYNASSSAGESSDAEEECCYCFLCHGEIVERSASCEGDPAVFCEGRHQQWAHASCAGVCNDRYEAMSNSSEPWLCQQCVKITKCNGDAQDEGAKQMSEPFIAVDTSPKAFEEDVEESGQVSLAGEQEINYRGRDGRASQVTCPKRLALVPSDLLSPQATCSRPKRLALAPSDSLSPQATRSRPKRLALVPSDSLSPQATRSRPKRLALAPSDSPRPKRLALVPSDSLSPQATRSRPEWLALAPSD